MKKLICLLMCIILGCSCINGFAQGAVDDAFIPYDKTDLYAPSDWATEYVEYAFSAGIIDAKEEYRFTSPITRLEFCEMVFNAVKLHSGLGSVLDIPISSPFTDTDSHAVALLNYAGIINGKSETEFKPDDFLTREEAATIVVRTVDRIGSLSATEIYFDFKDGNEISDWAMESVQKICNLGFMIGVGDNRFAPKEIFTTEQAVTILVRVFEELK